MPAVLDHDAISAALATLPDWRAFDDALHARFEAPDFPTAVRLVERVSAAAEELNHHPDIDIRWKKISFTLATHSAGGVTEHDLTLAGRISVFSRELRATPAPGALHKLEIAIDCLNADTIREFWRAGMDLRQVLTPDGTQALIDPSGELPALWFQQMTQPRTDRNRIHIDVYVPREEAEGRVAAVLAAGGRLVTDEHAPGWWVLADAEGNELCVCV